MTDGIEEGDVSEHIHHDIVNPDGSVSPINPAPIPGWENGGKRRRMLQPIKDELRRQLEVASAEAAYWRAKCDDAVAELGGEVHRLRFASIASLIVGILLGGWLL